MHLLITFGPTWEAIDPIRVITNRSTGTMGYAVAEEALRHGHRVSCVVGPCPQKPLKGASWIWVEGGRQMERQVKRLFPSHATEKRDDRLPLGIRMSPFRTARKINLIGNETLRVVERLL